MMPTITQRAALAASMWMLAGSAATYTQSGPLKLDVAVVVRNPAVAVPAGFTVFHGAKGIETPGFNFEETLKTELIAALAADRPTVIQLALDRRWVSVDQPATT